MGRRTFLGSLIASILGLFGFAGLKIEDWVVRQEAVYPDVLSLEGHKTWYSSSFSCGEALKTQVECRFNKSIEGKYSLGEATKLMDQSVLGKQLKFNFRRNTALPKGWVRKRSHYALSLDGKTLTCEFFDKKVVWGSSQI